MTIRPVKELEQVFLDLPAKPGSACDVVGLGSNAVDWILRIPHFPDHAGKLRLISRTRLIGGQVATATALCARWGLRVRYVARVGEDAGGRFMKQALEQDPLDLSYFETVEGAGTQTAFVLVDDEGERTILWQRDSALFHEPDEILPEMIQDGRILHMDTYNLPGCLAAARLARQAGVKVSLDVDRLQTGIEELLELTDFLVPTLSFAHRVTGLEDIEEALLALDEAVRGLVVATAGSGGCYAVWDQAVFHVPALDVKPLDTTGAGDVFHGAFVYSLFQDWSLARCLRFANAAAALSTTRLGSRNGIPEIAQVEQLLS